MPTLSPTRMLCAAIVLVSGAAFAATPAAKAPSRSGAGYPTVDRVLYVQDCVRDHPGPPFEMITKCSCAIDKMAEQVKFDDYVNMTTIVNAITIGGERGGELRDNETVKPQLARWRELQSKVQNACFIGGPAK
jgi:hypothetical protein